jgi:hypothetical protein
MLEAFEATIGPGGAPTMLRGIDALIDLQRLT